MRIGPGYSRMRRRIASADQADPQQLERDLLVRLRALLQHAFDKVPFYADFYGRNGFAPHDLATLDDWKRVPVVTKQDLQSYPLEVRTAVGRNGCNANTGGTSGAPLGFLLENNAVPIEWAHMHTIWSARGYRTSQMKLRLGGAYFPGGEPIRYHPRHNEYIVNTNCDMAEVVDAVVRLPRKRAIRWIHGYPSIVAEFAHALAGATQAASFRQRLFGVLLGSEFPAPVYREPIARLLSSNVVSWYGHSEMALLARETALGVYQSLPTYGYCEAVPASEAEGHRLVSTSLHNYVHPFIRYDTGDLIEPLAASGGALAFRISEGRIGDFVVDRKLRRLALTSIIFGRHHPAFDELRHLQVRQLVPGVATLLVVPKERVQDPDMLLRGFDFSGLDVEWGIEVIGAPIRSQGGKIRLKVGD
jgi:phenylacetate-CoA ligase